ncbi:GNAT family acetyltransferase [Clostridium sp.]|uniref:GNAT family acetyltransferase n=1 Tax=Clostridium sp. TaxID=1506 RepID=UPI002FC7ECED
MKYRTATLKDIPNILKLQQKYHISTISEEDKIDGFVTTLFTEHQFKELIEKENGLVIACDGEKVVAYAMAASWQYWSAWPLFQHMIKDLPHTEYLGQTLSMENSYQYGPVCIHKDYRGSDVLSNIFELSRLQMRKRYPILITFINQINNRSFKAHTKKIELDVIKTFEFNNNQYYELGYDTSKKTPGCNTEMF